MPRPTDERMDRIFEFLVYIGGMAELDWPLSAENLATAREIIAEAETWGDPEFAAWPLAVLRDCIPQAFEVA